MITTREADPTRTHRAPAPPAPQPAAPATPRPAPSPLHVPAISPLHATAAPNRWRRPVLIAIGLIAVYGILALLDRPAFKYFFVGLDRIDKLEEADWYRLLRVMGSLWMWTGIALILLVNDWAAVWRAPSLSLERRLPAQRWGALTRGLCVFLAPMIAGIFAEGVKRMVGRLRPIETDGFYTYAAAFDALLDPPNGMASSHTAVAFGGIIVLISFFPRFAWVLLPAAAGCAFTRIISGAHFLTDVYLGALLGCAAARIFTPPLIRALDPFPR
jgi:membrane-associated phospholipid phosphatase